MLKERRRPRISNLCNRAMACRAHRTPTHQTKWGLAAVERSSGAAIKYSRSSTQLPLVSNDSPRWNKKTQMPLALRLRACACRLTLDSRFLSKTLHSLCATRTLRNPGPIENRNKKTQTTEPKVKAKANIEKRALANEDGRGVKQNNQQQ